MSGGIDFATLVASGDEEAVRSALTADPSLANRADPENRWTPLHHATKSGRVAVVTQLLKASADITACTHHDSTALHIAACNAGAKQSDPTMVVALEQIAVLLLDHGCPPDALDNKGNTALHRAAQHGSVGIFREIYARTGDDGRTNHDCQTVGDRAKVAGHAAILECLRLATDTASQRE